jgi:hypothetical protein
MGLAKVRMVIRVHQRADGRPEIPAGGPVQPPPGPAGVVLDRRIPGAAPPGPHGLLRATRRRFDPSSSPSASHFGSPYCLGTKRPKSR